MGNKRWSNEEEELIRRYYRSKGAKWIAKKTERSSKAIHIKVLRMGLSWRRDDVDTISASLLGELLKYDRHLLTENWIKTGLLKATKRNNRWNITTDNFFKFAIENSNLVKLNELEENILGKEPDEIKKLRKEQMKGVKKYLKWEKWEDDYIKMHFRKKNIREIAGHLNRSERATQTRVYSLNLVKTKIIRINWREEELELLISRACDGYSNRYIAYELGRSVTMVSNRKRKMTNKGILVYKNKKYYRGEECEKRLPGN